MVDVHLNWFNWFHFLSFEGSLLVILIDNMIFLSPLLDVTRTSMSTVSFLAQVDSGILGLNGFKSKINRHLLIVVNYRFFLKGFPVCFNLFVLLFLVTPCLAVAVQPCME